MRSQFCGSFMALIRRSLLTVSEYCAGSEAEPAVTAIANAARRKARTFMRAFYPGRVGLVGRVGRVRRVRRAGSVAAIGSPGRVLHFEHVGRQHGCGLELLERV